MSTSSVTPSTKVGSLVEDEERLGDALVIDAGFVGQLLLGFSGTAKPIRLRRDHRERALVMASRGAIYEAMRIKTESLPEAEREHAAVIGSSLDDLDGYLNNFAAALSLFDSCDNASGEAGPHRGTYISWMMIAARDGAMTIYHFGKTIDGIRQSLGLCPTLRGLVSRPSLKTAGKLFARHFPSFEKLRHGVAHAGEQSSTLRARRKHALRGDYAGSGFKIRESSGTLLGNNLQDRLFTTSHEGTVLTYEISQATLAKLIEVKDAFRAAFAPASA